MDGTYDFQRFLKMQVYLSSPTHAIDSISNQITGRSVNYQIKNLQIAFPSGFFCVHIGIKEVTVMQFFAFDKEIESNHFYLSFRNIYVYKYDNMIVNRIKCTGIRVVSVIIFHSRVCIFYLLQSINFISIDSIH